MFDLSARDAGREVRTEVLNAGVFTSLAAVRDVTEAWLGTYNTERPHDSLDGVPPRSYLPRPSRPESLATICTRVRLQPRSAILPLLDGHVELHHPTCQLWIAAL